MVSVLYIGKYEEGGRFTTIQWEYFVEWCKTECNRIIVYSKMSHNTICIKFPFHCIINELEKPDKTLDVYAYEINVNNVVFWDYIKKYNYDIDIEDDISHMFFFYEKRYVASLEIVDYENYILMENPINQEDKILFEKEIILENIRFCIDGKSHIVELLKEENWKPLGCN